MHVVSVLHHKHLLDFWLRERLIRNGAHQRSVVLGDFVQRQLAKDLSIGQHHRQVVLVQRLARHATHQPALRTVREGQVIRHLVEEGLAHRTIHVLRVHRVALRRLQGGQARLHGHRQHRLRGQLKQAIVLVAEVQDQLLPPIRIEERLVRLQFGACGEREHSHELADLSELVGEVGKILLRVSHRVHSFVLPDQLHELLDAQLELNRRVDLAQLRFVLVAPHGELGGLVLAQLGLHLARHLEDIEVGQVANSTAHGQLLGTLVVAEAQEVFDEHAIQSRLLPLVRGSYLQFQVGRWQRHKVLDMVQATFAHVTS